VTVQRLDARGRGTALLDKTGFYLDPRLSPDGQRLVVTSNGDIWVDDLRRGTLTRLTFTGGCSNPIWTADGRFIVYRGPRSIFWIRADESAQPTVLISDENALVPSAFSTTASRLAFVELNAATGADLWTVPIENDGRSLRAGKAEIFLRTRFNERAPAFSPDGRWMAYSSDETGTLEVYVRKFPDNGGKIQVSDGGGNFPVWSKDSHRLFFTNGDLKNEVMVVNYTLQGSAIDFDKVRHWSSAKLSFSPPSRNYDVAADGKTVVAVVASDGGQRTAERHVIFLQNFSDELQRRVAPPAPHD
jgi:serine/threonine-protein kinase